MIEAFTRPEWTICGIARADGGVMVMASRDLIDAEIEAVYEHPERSIFDPYQPISMLRYVEQRIRMRTYAVAFGRTYEEAFTHLFEHWSPDEPPAELPAAQTAIEP